MTYDSIPIRLWVAEDRPVDKFIAKGRNALTDAELLSIIIGNGLKGRNSFDIAKELLKTYKDNLTDVAQAPISNLTKIVGINKTIATRILATLEIGRRKYAAEIMLKEKIASSRDAFEVFRPLLEDKPYEEFWVLFLNKANRIAFKEMISTGGITGTVVDPKKIFKIALDHYATSIIMGHNHPSDNIQPSEADQKITRKIRDASLMLDIAVLDHLIIGNNQFYSFADEGLI